MPRGRPRLAIGQHGHINRRQLSPGVWEARCRYRGADGVVRLAQKQSPMGAADRRGAAAEAALTEHLAKLLAGSAGSDDGAVTAGTAVSVLLNRHLDVLREAGKSVSTLRSYGYRIGYWNQVAEGITVGDCTPGRLDRHLTQVRAAHGDTDAKQLRTLLGYALDYAVRDGVLTSNPARATKPLPKKKPTKPRRVAAALDPEVLPEVLNALLTSEVCRKKDLTDPVLMHLGTGLRVSEVLAFAWSEFDPEAATITSTSRIVWEKGHGLLRVPTAESSKGTPEIIDLPPFAVAALLARSQEERPNTCGLIFPSAVGTMRDPTNFARQWRGVRDDLEHLAGSTGHTFRKTVSDLAADGSGDPRVAADVLGHKDVATTLRHYLTRGRRHPEVAGWIEKAVKGTPSPSPRRAAKPA